MSHISPVWWNGRHVCLRSICESVGVRVPSPAPTVQTTKATLKVATKTAVGYQQVKVFGVFLDIVCIFQKFFALKKFLWYNIYRKWEMVMKKFLAWLTFAEDSTPYLLLRVLPRSQPKAQKNRVCLRRQKKSTVPRGLDAIKSEQP